jgi:protease IV
MGLLAHLVDLVYDAFLLLRNLVAFVLSPRSMYVLLDLSGPYPEHRGPRVWGVRQPPSVDDVRRQLREVAADGRVAGVVLEARDLGAGLASIQGLRAAVESYRAGGGRVVAFLPHASTRLYYLATAADAIVMPESGTLDLVGLSLQATFLGDALGRLGVVGEFEQIAEYKTAAEPFIRRAMSEPMRESWNALLDSVFDDLIREIALARRLDPAFVRTLVDRAPLSAREAREAGLVDGLLFEDELPTFLAAGRPRPPAVVPWALARRLLRRRLRWTRRRAIGVVDVRGMIHMGESRVRPPLPIPVVGDRTAGHATVSRALRASARDPRIGAVIVSVESPGGSALASDLIWREVEQVARTKPVVAFLRNVAGSGGYYVAVGAARIIGHPATLTGSIGVIGGKFTVQGLAARAGVTREILARGEAAAMSSPFVHFSEEERRRLRKQMTEIYDRFVDRVAAGRKMAREDVLAVARGRVWTGLEAQRRGLVDAVGDFPAAVAAAKELMGVPAGRDVPLLHIRAPRSVAVGSGGARAALGDLWTGVAALLEERALTLMPWDLHLR